MAEEEYKGARKRLSRMFGLSGRIAPFGGGGGGVAPPPPPVIPIQNFTDNLVGAYSLRRVNPSAAFACDITNASGTGSFPAIFSPITGDIDMVDLQANINANLPGPFYILSWRDQSPLGGNDASNFPGSFGVALSNCPAIADAAGNIFTQNGKPCIRFGLNNIPTWLSIPYQTLNAKYFVLSNMVQVASLQPIFMVPTDDTLFNSFSRGSVVYDFIGSTLYASEQNSAFATARSIASLAPPSRLLLHSQHNTTTLKTNIRYNGSVVPPSSESISALPNPITYMHIGNAVSGDIANGWASIYFKGDIQEVFLYSQPQEIYINGLTANIMQYWGL